MQIIVQTYIVFVHLLGPILLHVKSYMNRFSGLEVENKHNIITAFICLILICDIK